MNTSVTVPATGPAGPARLNAAADIAVRARQYMHGAGLPGSGPDVAIGDWNLLFDAVRARLVRTVGERLGEPPAVPQHSSELAASLVQAVVLDCAHALDQLHAALEQERSQRPTP